MNNFKDFGIKPVITHFTGDKIKIEKILNVEILVHDFKIEPSKTKPGTNFLTMQIEKSNTRHVLFTGSVVLQQQIEKVPREKLPFKTTIIKNDEHLEFS